jgi:hypothetical protein
MLSRLVWSDGLREFDDVEMINMQSRPHTEGFWLFATLGIMMACEAFTYMGSFMWVCPFGKGSEDRRLLEDSLHRHGTSRQVQWLQPKVMLAGLGFSRAPSPKFKVVLPSILPLAKKLWLSLQSSSRGSLRLVQGYFQRALSTGAGLIPSLKLELSLVCRAVGCSILQPCSALMLAEFRCQSDMRTWSRRDAFALTIAIKLRVGLSTIGDRRFILEEAPRGAKCMQLNMVRFRQAFDAPSCFCVVASALGKGPIPLA